MIRRCHQTQRRRARSIAQAGQEASWPRPRPAEYRQQHHAGASVSAAAGERISTALVTGLRSRLKPSLVGEKGAVVPRARAETRLLLHGSGGGGSVVARCCHCPPPSSRSLLLLRSWPLWGVNFQLLPRQRTEGRKDVTLIASPLLCSLGWRECSTAAAKLTTIHDSGMSVGGRRAGGGDAKAKGIDERQQP